MCYDKIENVLPYGFNANSPYLYVDILGLLANNDSSGGETSGLKKDRDDLERKLIESCPEKGHAIKTSWSSCCEYDSCVEQAKNIADAIYEVVDQMHEDIVVGGWFGNYMSLVGFGYKCHEWQSAIMDALENIDFGENSCFKGIGVADFFPLTELVRHQWTNIYGADAKFLMPNRLNIIPHIQIDPWQSGGQRLFEPNKRKVDIYTDWR